MDKLQDRWLKNRKKWEKYRKVWQKPTKSGRKQIKMTENFGKCEVLQIILYDTCEKHSGEVCCGLAQFNHTKSYSNT